MNGQQHILKSCIVVVLISQTLAFNQCKKADVYSDQKAYRKCEEAVKEAGKKGFQYLTKQLKKNSGSFLEGERAAGILGLLAGSQAYDSSKKFNRRIKGRGGFLLSNSVAIDFLIRINELKSEYPNSLNPLEHMDYTSLIQYMGIIRAFCKDSKNYHGFDLYREVERRLEDNDEKLFGGLFLALCNTDYPLEDKVITKQLKGTVQEPTTSPFYVAETSLKLLASICTEMKLSSQIINDKKDNALKAKRKALGDIKDDLARKLNEYFQAHNTFGKFLDIALATQPLNSLSQYSELYFRSIPELMDMQKQDGSFGGSVPFTAVALSSLTHITPSDLNNINCNNNEKPKGPTGNPIVRLSYVIEDKVITGQRTTSSFNVPKGSNLLSALKDHSNSNPHTFKLIISSGHDFAKIVSWNNIANKDNLQAYWRVQKEISTGSLEDITDKLNKEALFQDTKYIISFITA